jgi:hypothetical protein
MEEGQEGGMEEAHAPLNGWGVTVGHERENELRDVKVMRGKPAVTLHGLRTRQGQGVRLIGGREGGSGGGRGGRRGGRVGIFRGLTVVGVLRCGGKGRRRRRGRYGKDQCRWSRAEALPLPPSLPPALPRCFSFLPPIPSDVTGQLVEEEDEGKRPPGALGPLPPSLLVHGQACEEASVGVVYLRWGAGKGRGK